MDLLITGAAGFLGSHFLFAWLRQNPNSRALCLVRSTENAHASDRVSTALNVAAYECGHEDALHDLAQRVTVIDTDLNDPSWRDTDCFREWLRTTTGFEVVHGAANLSFRGEDRSRVWETNVVGTGNFFRALAGLTALHAFNYISTAYVAGNREGCISEDVQESPTAFNNVYEESKWAAEKAVRALAAEQRIPFRIFRPSIVIGHSRTFRISARTGFYKVVETLLQVSQARPMHKAAIRIPVQSNASLNLIPVDLAVLEMVDVIAAGEHSRNRVFHLTNERPVSLADLFFGVSPLTGVQLTCADESAKDTDQMSALVTRGLRHYLPYFRYSRTFERDNVHACGAARHQQEYWLDLVKLRHFVQAFIKDQIQTVDETEPLKASA
jgi:thioester reductase-like protein